MGCGEQLIANYKGAKQVVERLTLLYSISVVLCFEGCVSLPVVIVVQHRHLGKSLHSAVKNTVSQQMLEGLINLATERLGLRNQYYQTQH